MLKGNKGEWSELYVLIKLLADGKLYQSDFNLEKNPEVYYEVVKAFKSESEAELEFDRGDKIQVYIVKNEVKSELGVYSIDQLSDLSQKVCTEIKTSSGNSFELSSLQSFLDECEIKRIAEKSQSKADIKIRIYDHRLAKETDLGFSIKSLLGGDSTLFNTGVGNNFIFKSASEIEESLDSLNSRTYTTKKGVSKITQRLQELKKLGVNLEFHGIQSGQLWGNLKMIDGDLPEILGWSLYYRYYYRKSNLIDVVDLLEENDPLNLYATPELKKQRMYEYKIKRFLTESAMGMTSETPWFGEYNSFGGVIIPKDDGEIVCFHIYDFNLFRRYLLHNTRFEQASTGENKESPGSPKTGGKNYHYGWAYHDNNEISIKLNLQIRFK